MWLYLLLAPIVLVAGGQQCYFGPGADNRGPDELVPCAGSGDSACCLQGDTCLAGNTCYNHATGDLYQFGCTDIHYEASVCPYKCGFNTSMQILRFPKNRFQHGIKLILAQPCHHGRLWSTVLTLTMSQTPGFAMPRRVVGAHGTRRTTY